MNRFATCLASLALLAGCGEATATPPQDNVATQAQVEAVSDAFGLDNIYPTRLGGTIWTSQWETSRTWFDVADPLDPWFDTDAGNATYRTEGGQLFISGAVPRMYVYDPDRERQWRDVEITIYFKRVSDTGIPHAGMSIMTRANHLDTSGRFECDTRGYGARMRYDGHIDFEKETAHPANDAISNKEFWNAPTPRNTWIGVKFVVFDDLNGDVHLEMWTDLTGGKGGGDWQKVNEVIDDGQLFGFEPCAEGIDPQLALTSDPERPGSESGLPNLTTYFRSDGVGPDGLVYKWASIREIDVL